MRCRLAAVIAACVGLAPAAHADKFYFGSADADEKMAGGANHYIEGVLLSETADSYVIRVAGGEITVAKSAVYKVEKDGLTVAQLEEREQKGKDGLSQANLRRLDVQAAEAAAERERAAAVAPPPPQEIVVTIDFQGLLPNYSFRVYDPVLDRADLGGLRVLIEDFLRNEVYRAAYRDPGESPPAKLIERR